MYCRKINVPKSIFLSEQCTSVQFYLLSCVIILEYTTKDLKYAIDLRRTLYIWKQTLYLLFNSEFTVASRQQNLCTEESSTEESRLSS